jgi:hypothetical protein
MAILTFKQRREICSLVMDYVDEYPNIYLDGAEYAMNNQEAYNDARILLLDILDVVATNVHNNNRR